MIRNLKALGLALVAVFAMSAMAASGASAEETQGELTSDGPVTLDGTEIPKTVNSFTAFGNTIQCPGTVYTGHKYDETPHEFLNGEGETTITVTRHHEPEPGESHNCVTETGGGSNFFITITMNDCDFVFHIGETTGEEPGTYAITESLDCSNSAKGYVSLEMYTSTSEAIKVCEVHMPGGEFNQGLAGAHATNNEGHVDISGTFKGIHTIRTAGLCGGELETEEAENHVNLTLEGTNEAEEPTDIEISDLRS